jgi:ubiquinone/menaquinone biosynthesis C-methylase UbiE
MAVNFSISEWHRQFVRQARWTRDWRIRLYRQAGLWQAQNILDVGCGTGFVTEEIAQHTKGKVIGLDMDLSMIEWAERKESRIEWTIGDACQLPFSEAKFDLVICNFLLLWVQNPAEVVREMVRVTKKGGFILDTAEPDYGGRIDYPTELPIAELMSKALRKAGANPNIGRQLRKLFNEAGLSSEIGVIASLWNQEQMTAELDEEWQLIERSIGDESEVETLERYKNLEKQAFQTGERLMFMPIFYAIGRK